MYKIKGKEEILSVYEKRYPELDRMFLYELGREYDRYIDLLKEAKTRQDALDVFEKEIQRNEKNYKTNADIKCLEGSTHHQYMEILSTYGMIVFFRDNLID